MLFEQNVASNVTQEPGFLKMCIISQCKKKYFLKNFLFHQNDIYFGILKMKKTMFIIWKKNYLFAIKMFLRILTFEEKQAGQMSMQIFPNPPPTCRKTQTFPKPLPPSVSTQKKYAPLIQQVNRCKTKAHLKSNVNF